MIFPETALFVVNYILSRRPRTPSPRREEIPYYGSRNAVSLSPAYSSRRGLKDYWVSPQRYYPAGSAWHTPTRRLLVLPGSMGVSEVESVHWPSSGRYRPHLMWKNHWQNLNHHYLGKRPRRFASWR